MVDYFQDFTLFLNDEIMSTMAFMVFDKEDGPVASFVHIKVAREFVALDPEAREIWAFNRELKKLELVG